MPHCTHCWITSVFLCNNLLLLKAVCDGRCCSRKWRGQGTKSALLTHPCSKPFPAWIIGGAPFSRLSVVLSGCWPSWEHLSTSVSSQPFILFRRRPLHPSQDPAFHSFVEGVLSISTATGLVCMSRRWRGSFLLGMCSPRSQPVRVSAQTHGDCRKGIFPSPSHTFEAGVHSLP